jgi:hypothetical protein
MSSRQVCGFNFHVVVAGRFSPAGSWRDYRNPGFMLAVAGIPPSQRQPGIQHSIRTLLPRTWLICLSPNASRVPPLFPMQCNSNECSCQRGLIIHGGLWKSEKSRAAERTPECSAAVPQPWVTWDWQPLQIPLRDSKPQSFSSWALFFPPRLGAFIPHSSFSMTWHDMT